MNDEPEQVDDIAELVLRLMEAPRSTTAAVIMVVDRMTRMEIHRGLLRHEADATERSQAAANVTSAIARATGEAS